MDDSGNGEEQCVGWDILGSYIPELAPGLNMGNEGGLQGWYPDFWL